MAHAVAVAEVAGRAVDLLVSDVKAAPSTLIERQKCLGADVLEALSIKVTITAGTHKSYSTHLFALLLKDGQQVVTENAFKLCAYMK